MSKSEMLVQRDIEVITHAEWMSMDKSVRNMATNIAKSIKDAQEKIAKAEELAKNVPNIKGNFLGIGKQSRVNDVLSKAQLLTSEANREHSVLIQQLINLIIRSAKTASDMQKALAYLAVNGIRDANGRVETLSSECTKSINTLIEHAQDFIQQQEEIEDRQNQLSERVEDKEAKDREQDIALKAIEKALLRYSENSNRQEQELSDLQNLIYKNQTEEEQNRKKLELEIEKNIALIKRLQETLFENQNIYEERLKKLEAELREVIALNRQFDEEERNRLKDEYRADVLKLKFTLKIVCSSIAAIAIASFILSIAM